MESMTDWAFSWPISVYRMGVVSEFGDELEDWGGGKYTLVVVNDVAQVVLAAVMRFADAHGVVG